MDLALELEICLEDIISARASAKPKVRRSNTTLSDTGESRAAFRRWIEEGAGDNSTEMEEMRRAYGRIQATAGTEYQRRLLAMSREGMSVKDIAEELDLSPSSVSRTLGRAKAHERELADLYMGAKALRDRDELVRGKLPIYTETQEKYLSMYRAGMTVTEIAGACGVNHSTVSMSINRALKRETKVMCIIGGGDKLRLDMENPEHFGAVMYAMTPRQQAAVYLRLGERQSRERCALLLHASPGNIDRLVEAGLQRAAKRLSAWEISIENADGMAMQLEKCIEGIFAEPEPPEPVRAKRVPGSRPRAVRRYHEPRRVKLSISYSGAAKPLSGFAARLFSTRRISTIFGRLSRWWRTYILGRSKQV